MNLNQYNLKDLTKLQKFPSEKNYDRASLIEDVKMKSYIFKSINDLFTLIIESDDNIPSINKFSLKGISLEHKPIKIKNSKLRKYLIIKPTHNKFNDLFVLLTFDILKNINKTNLQDVILKTINKWKYFTSDKNNELLSIDKQIGLIGELILLNKIIDDNVHNINSWVADTQSIDFAIKNNLIEVKTTLKDKHSHIINGLDQLKIINDKNKYILSILVKKSDIKTSDTLNLVDYIEQIENKIAEDPEIQDIFYSKLKKVGYNEINRAKYTEYNFIIIDKLFYQVNGNMPKITSDSFTSPLNSRINKITYNLDLDGLDCLKFEELTF
tara:strand:+ start:563 stop:1540 length:978 start_codon:yes stop_codon:yes gene_type:complete